MKDLKNNIKIFKLTTLVLFGVILLEILFSKRVLNRFCPNPNADLVQKAKPTAETKIEKSFEFPVKKLGSDKFKVSLLKAEKVGLITSKNQPVVAKEGKEFLLIYLELENNLVNPLIIDSQNYFRLESEQDKKLAPDLFNGPIQIAPISTKKDQVGFNINKGKKEFKLQVGEIEGTKEIIEIKF